MQAKNLIVLGSSRLLGKIYCNDLEINGSSAFNGDLGVSGKATVGQLHITSVSDIAGNSDTTSVAPVLIGAINGTHLEIDQNEIHAKASANTTTTLFLNDNGGEVHLSGRVIASGGTISAQNGTFSSNISSVTITNSGNIYNRNGTIETDEIKSNVWDIVSVQNLGGDFYVCPTIVVTNNSAFTISSVSGNTIVGTLKDSTNITGNSFGGHSWTSGSKIKITGKLTSGSNNYVLGVCDGTLTANMNTTSGTINFSVTCNASTVPSAGSYTISEGTVMMYNVGGSNPVGIHMTSYGSNKVSYIDIYNGSNGTSPKARIGKLDGLGTVNDMTPTGYGIYTDNGYFAGVVVANGGKIGGWTIGDSYITTNTSRTTYDSTSQTGMTMTSGGIGGRGSASQYFTLSSSGLLTAVGATITTATIGSGTNKITLGVSSASSSYSAIKSGMTSLSDTTNNGFYIGTDGIALGKGVFKVTNAGVLTAKSGTIGGSNITSSSLYSGSKSSYNSSNSGYYLGSDGKFGLGNGSSYIQYDGTSLNIKGNLTLTSGQSVEEYVGDMDIGGRNLLLDTENMYKWKLKRGASINNGVATFIDVSNNVWREIESTFTLPYSNIRNKTVTMSCYVKATSGLSCAINLCLGVSGSKYSYNRKNYKNCYIYFTGTGKWEKVSTKVDITDAYFTSDSGSDFENGNIAFVAGAVNSYHNGFQAKKFKLELGDFATDWSPAPEDAIKGDGQNMFINTYDTSMISGNRYSRPMLKDQATFTYMLNTFTIVPHGIRQVRTSSYPIFRFGTGTIGTETLNGFVAGETYTLSFDCTYNLFGSGAGFSSSETAYLNLYFYDNRDDENSYTNVWTMTFHTYDAEDTSDRGQTFTKHVEFTYYVPDNVTKCYFMVRSHSTTSSHFATGDFVEIRNLMLEKGTNSSGYAPSSYDLERISYGSGNLFTNSDTFEGWGINELASIEIVDGVVDYRERNLLGDTSNSTAPTTQNSNASNTFGSIGGYNTSASSISVGTYDESSNYLTATETATGNRGVGWYTKSGVVEYGEVITFSCRVKANISTSVHTHTAWRNNSSDDPSTASYTGWTNGGSATIEANTWTDYSYTFTCGSLYPEGEFYVALCFTGNSSGLTWQVAHAKLEKGNTATDWTPAPEDADANNEPAIDIDEDGAKIVHYWLKQGSGEATWRQIANALDDNGVYIPYSKVRNKRLTFSCYVKYANAEDVSDDNVMRFVLALCHEDSSTRSRYSYQLTPYPSSNQWSSTTDWQRIYFTFKLTDDLLSQTGEAQNTALDPVNDRLFIQFYNHSFKECWIKKPMLTIGTVVEDWSPEQFVSTNVFDILSTTVNTVTDTLESESERLDSLTSNYTKYKTDNDGNITRMNQGIADVTKNFNDYKAQTENYMRYDSNAGLLQLGALVNGKMKSSLDLTSQRLEFKLYDSNTGKALPDSSYMTAKMLYNTNVQANNALVIGNNENGRFTFVNLGSGIAFGLASDLLSPSLLIDAGARSGDTDTAT